jgi:Raf kinase inhibitor-like YbhB/YbcL family protein
METIYKELIVRCRDLRNGDTFPIKYTHRGDEISPEFILKNLSQSGKTIAIIFDDLDHPMHHWRIWNIPAISIIPENLLGDKILSDLGSKVPNNKYRGPNPPKGIRHKYQFNIYVLDCELIIKNNSNKKQLVKSMEGHIIQYGSIYGYYE